MRFFKSQPEHDVKCTASENERYVFGGPCNKPATIFYRLTSGRYLARCKKHRNNTAGSLAVTVDVGEYAAAQVHES